MSVKLLDVGSTPTSGAQSTDCFESASITSEAYSILRDLPETPQNWVAIWGPARCGKSFFLNCLARCGGENALFPDSNKYLVCTVGADLSKTTLKLHEFLHGTGTVGDGGNLASVKTPSIDLLVCKGRETNISRMRSFLRRLCFSCLR